MTFTPPRQASRSEIQILLVIQHLLKNADYENAVTMNDILSHLAKYGIEADRRSVYRDIHDLMELLNTEPRRKTEFRNGNAWVMKLYSPEDPQRILPWEATLSPSVHMSLTSCAC